MPGDSHQRTEVAVFVDNAGLRRSVAEVLGRSDRYRVAPAVDRPADGAIPAAIVTNLAEFERSGGELAHSHEAGCRIVVILSDDELVTDDRALAVADGFVSERKIEKLLHSTLLLSAFGLSPVPERFISLAM